ncbi:hypothetical protein HK097_011021 [Rhizophlyctis rosea]|uniref:Secreted protein n=1 Tax=Rhizophlyctis rosea TaxID=64517 RepID=A0AAD5S965_9FUNG|nr:hypothetical protein HK097_011021 [Rhizophlyctis rosea]
MHFNTFVAVAALSSVGVNAAGQWNRRIYYDNVECKPTGFAYAISVYSPVAGCPGGATTDKVSLVSTCIPKSNDTRAPSSEGSGCDDVPGTVSDAEWAVPNGQGAKIAGIPYLVTNAYGNAEGCAISSSTNAITQTIYAADQKCHAYEPGVFFKAACNNDGGIVLWCTDSACTQCGKAGTFSEGVPGVVSFTSNCSTKENNSPAKSICSGGSNDPLPKWSESNTVSSTVSSKPAAASPTGGAAGNGTSSTPAAGAGNSGAGKKEGVAVGALFAAVVAAIAI